MKETEFSLLKRAAESVFTPLIRKQTKETSADFSVPLKVLVRRINQIAAPVVLKPNITDVTKMINDESLSLQLNGTAYEIIFDGDGEISGGAVKRLERTVDRRTKNPKTSRGTVYRKNSTVKERRRANGNWYNGSRAKLEAQLKRNVIAIPENVRQRQKEEIKRTSRANDFQTKYGDQLDRWNKELQNSPKPPGVCRPPFVTLCENPEVIEKLPSNAILSIGFAVDSTVPLRVVGYPLLALEILKYRPDLSLEMYVATQFSELFSLNTSKSKGNAKLIKTSVQAFVKEFFSEPSSRVVFVDTREISPRQSQLLDKLSGILAKNPDLQNFAKSRSGAASLRYMAAHTLYMRDPLPIDNDYYLVLKPTDRKEVVMIGGEGEKIMWKARQTILQAYGKKEPLQIFTTVGRTPPYFRKGSEPLAGEEVSSDFLLKAIPEVYRDYAMILVAIAQAKGDELTSFAISATDFSRQQFLDQESIQLSLLYLNLFSYSLKRL